MRRPAPAAPAGRRDFGDLVVVTPEHVPIRLTPAGLGSRFLAVTADALIVAGITATVQLVLFAGLPPGIALAVLLTVNFVLNWGYHVYFESRHQGRSPGKRIAGLRVVDARGLPVSPQQSLVRNLFRILDAAPLFYGIGGVVALADKHRRRLGDIVADTLVIEESTGLDYGGELGRARRFNSLRTPAVLRAIRHRIGLEEREFLLTLCLRAERLEHGARFDLMEEAGNAYRERLGIDDPHLSGENLVRDLTSILFGGAPALASPDSDRLKVKTLPASLRR